MGIQSLPPKAVIWDMDGTIFDTERLVVDCWEELCLAQGYEVPRSTLLKCIGRNSRESNEILRSFFGENDDIDQLRAKKSAMVNERIERDGLPVKKGIHEALEWIAAREVPTALASSSDYDKILSRLRLSDLQPFFSVIVGGDQITNGKPHPEIFLTAAHKLQVDPKDCIVFEDSHNGVIAAHEAGMQVVMIPDLIEANDDISKRAHHILESGAEIIPLLSQLFSRP